MTETTRPARAALSELPDGAARELAGEEATLWGAVIDQGSKKALYAKSGVPWYWILDPQNRTITVLELETGAYQTRALVGDHGTARLAPFDELDIQLDALFPPTAG